MSTWFVDPEDLITEVESRPLLYVKSLPEYSKKVLKNDAWQEVARNLSEDWEMITKAQRESRCRDAQAKWKHIRDNFRREYLAQKDAITGKGVKKRKRYRYYEELQFLIPHIKHVETFGNYVITVNSNSEENVEGTISPKMEHSRHSTSPVNTTNDLLIPIKHEPVSFYQEEVLQPTKTEMPETDEDITFCLSLVESLKRMDNDTKVSAKIEMLNVIRRFSKRSRNVEDFQP